VICGAYRGVMGRRDRLTVVPTLIGFEVRVAHDRALDARLLAVVEEGAAGLRVNPHAIVRAQRPEAGRQVGVGSRVRIWIERGGDGDGRGGSGDRLPTGPGPREPSGFKPLG